MVFANSIPISGTSAKALSITDGHHSAVAPAFQTLAAKLTFTF